MSEILADRHYFPTEPPPSQFAVNAKHAEDGFESVDGLKQRRFSLGKLRWPPPTKMDPEHGSEDRLMF